MKTRSKLLSIALTALMAAAPLQHIYAAETGADAQEVSAITISLNNRDLRVQNAEGSILKIYNVTGVCVAVLRIDSNDKTFVLNYQRACYILKIGKLARKINLL